MAGLATLGGIGRGISRGAKDIRDWEEEKFRKTQRERLLKEQADEDALKGELAAVQPEGTSAVADESGGHSVTRTGEQVMRERAGIYQKRGKDDTANTLLNRAEGLKDRAAKEATMKRIMEARAEFDKDPIGWGVKHYNTQVQDGRVVAPMSTPNGVVGNVINLTTGKTESELPLTRDMAEAAFRTFATMQLAGTNDPEVWTRGMIENGKLLQEEKRTALAGEKLGLDRTLGAAHADYYGAAAQAQRAHARLYDRTDPNLRAGHGGAGGAGKPFKMKVMVSDPANPGKKVPTEIMATLDPKTGDRKFLDATGRDVTNDPRIQAAIQGATEDSVIDEQHEMLLAKARDAYGKGEMDDASYDAKVLAIRQRQEYAKAAAEYRRSSPEERKVMLDTLLENPDLTPKAVSKILGISETVVNARRAELKQLGIKKKAEAKAEEQRILTAPRTSRPPVVPGEPQPDTP